MDNAEPWLANKKWQGGKVRDGAGGQVALRWIFTLLFAGASVAIVSAVIQKPALRHDFPVVIAVLFPLATLVLLVQALLITARWARFGSSVFEMATFPGVIGGQLVGIVYTKVKLQASDGFDVALTCVHRVWSGSGNSKSCQDIVIWHEEEHLVRGVMEQDMTRSAIPVGFRIPRDCKATFHATGYDQVMWKLRVRAKVPRVDYEANFDVPVYVTGESDAGVGAEVDPVAPYRAAAVVRTGVTEKGVKFWKDESGKVHVRFRAGRNFGATVVWCVVTAVIIATTYYLWKQSGKGIFDAVILHVMLGGFGFMSLLFLFLCFILLFQHKEVVADSREVVVRTNYLFVFRFVQRVAAGEVQDIRMVQNQTSGERAWFEIDLVVPWKKADGSVEERNVCVGIGIEKGDAEWLVRELKRVVGGVNGTSGQADKVKR